MPPYSPDYGDIYHPPAGAWQQARKVFMTGNGLPGRWQGRDRFVILETGFGLGNNFLATWAAWRQDPQRCDRLFFISIEKHPLRPEDFAAVHATQEGTPHIALNGALLPEADADDSENKDNRWRQALASHLLACWPPLTPGWHTLQPDSLTNASGQEQSITLLLGLGDVATLLPSLQASIDAFFLDGFTPAKNPEMWHGPVLSRIGRLANAGATVATWSSARVVRDALALAQFDVKKRPGDDGKWATTSAVHTPRYVHPPKPGGLWPCPQRKDVIVIGAGIAGCSAADALTREGWRVTLLDAADGPARAASGNPGGLFHTVVHGDDGTHARAHRAAALATWLRVSPWIKAGRLPGQACGLLRLDPKQAAEGARAMLARQPWLHEQAEWLTQAQASELCGVQVPSGGWHLPQGGWFSPADACRLMLNAAESRHRDGSSMLSTRWATTVHALAHSDSGWQALGAHGQVLAEAGSLVLATAWQADRLLSTLPPEQAVESPPCSAVRGQISLMTPDPDAPRASAPGLPVAGQGYALTLPDGRILCGATTQHNDTDSEPRTRDHLHNLTQAQRLGVLPKEISLGELQVRAAMSDLSGRVGWRATTPDRLPLVGALAWHRDRLIAKPPARAEQVRMLPRARDERGGLYIIGGLGSRGLTWSVLAADLLTHWVCGTPCPVEAELRDALDPARFLARQNRHA